MLSDALAAITTDLARIEGRPAPDVLVAMGGAITNIAAVKHGLKTYDPDIVQGTVLDRAEIDRQIELYRSRNAAQRRAIVELQPKRADVILAGACIVLRLEHHVVITRPTAVETKANVARPLIEYVIDQIVLM